MSTSYFQAVPLPQMDNSDYMTGIYYNILTPLERENRCEPELVEYFTQWLTGKRPEFLKLEQLETLNSYALTNVARVVLEESRLLPLFTQSLQDGSTIENALVQAKSKIKKDDLPHYQEALEQLKNLRTYADRPATYTRYTILIDNVQKCIQELDAVLEKRSSFLKSGIQEVTPSLSEHEQKLERFENRRAVMVEQIKDIRAKVPNGACFFAMQEASAEAVFELQEDLKELFPTWVSFNNATGKETCVIENEEICGESTAFTSTLALSPELRVIRHELGDLPSPSGIHPRKILGVEVENTITNRRFALFTTHTEHIPESYHDTVIKVHAFISQFIAATPDMPIVFGGDLNAFNGPGQTFIKELRGGLFEGGQDYREGCHFYVHKSIADATFLGLENAYCKAKFIDGKVESNDLDHIFTKNVEVIAGFRSAVVYDENGKLIDPYSEPVLYQDRLEKRRTASDHFLNAVIFRES